MARTRTISDEKIITAARAEFLKHGFGASTMVIAKRAGVSETLLFKRFGTKNEMFAKAMGIEDPPLWVKALEGLESRGEARENIKKIAKMMMEFMSEILPRVIMSWAARDKPPLKWMIKKSPMQRDLKALVAYFEREMKAGRIRSGNPEIAARALIGSLHHLVFMKIMGGKRATPAEMDQQVEELVDLLWEGMEPIEEDA
ncbi:MAG: TetR/AcrR family transcriptional regulator [Proteobacteria bacterium]|nr:TetR/AcrR family transcriptional regulator [Pseudomonadota bacterium]